MSKDVLASSLHLNLLKQVDRVQFPHDKELALEHKKKHKGTQTQGTQDLYEVEQIHKGMSTSLWLTVFNHF